MILSEFNQKFPTEDACLEFILRQKYPRKKLYKLKGRKAYCDKQGKQTYPLKGTIFENSQTSLLKWFYAIYLFSVAKNGVSAAELQRHLGVTYKCAWRMGHQIRKLMTEDGSKLCGVVEADETYMGKRRTGTQMVLLGAVERGRRVRVQVTRNRREESVLPFLEKNIRKGTKLMTDEAHVYKISRDFKHKSVNHSKYQWARGEVHTNHIEGFWGQLKRGIRGTHHYVSPKHLSSYVSFWTFHYNHRNEVFSSLIQRI